MYKVECTNCNHVSYTDDCTVNLTRCDKCNSLAFGLKTKTWVGVRKDALAAEIGNRMRHLYARTDGTMRFPSSAEGDLLKLVHVLLSRTDNNKETEDED
jgi:hypothetical protein